MDESGDKRLSSLESTYHYYRQLFEDRSRMSWQEEACIRSPVVQGMVQELYSEFWKSVNTITIDYFKIITMLNKKKDVVSSIMDIWTQYVSPPKKIEPCIFDLNVGITDDFPAERYPKSQMLSGVINWYKSRVVRYKTASEFAGELRMAVVKAIKDAGPYPEFGKFPTPGLHALKTRLKWFNERVRELKDTIAELDKSRYSVRKALFSADQGPADNRIELTVRKTKTNNRKPKRTNNIMGI